MLEYRIIYNDKKGMVSLESMDASVSALKWKTKDQETRLADGAPQAKPRKFIIECCEVTEWKEV